MKKEKSSEKVFKHIESKIVNGIWKPGDKITPELQLVKELGVSRLAVREATQKLASMDILVKKRGGGTFVSEINTGDYMKDLIPLLTIGKIGYKEIMEFRTSLDILGVRLCTKRADDETLENLQEIHENMIKNRENPSEFFKYDMEFHRAIAVASGNRILQKTIEIIFDILIYNVEDEYHQLSYDDRIEEHTLVLRAIKNRDVELAELYMKRHVDRTIKDLEKIEFDTNK
ncbi:FadR/GntR family transcriptional regulator [uncultured Ilyobacter sp.]|uniref:FadR/GntR family transcriptional regulator n=1 Tax=uncultured Ilyobacter sp. TaxID=544433 RepID=UPI0029C00B57|nr:FadR/GntR family transcriptional regulator [uncultured Ilyobacter sp.]